MSNFKIKYNKFDFDYCCAPGPAGGDLLRTPDLLAEIKGAYFLREGRKWEGGGKGRRERKGRHCAVLKTFFRIFPASIVQSLKGTP